MQDFEIERVNLCKNANISFKQRMLANSMGLVSRKKLDLLLEVESIGIIPMIRHASSDIAKDKPYFGCYFTLVSDISGVKPTAVCSSEYFKSIDDAIDDVIDKILAYLKSNNHAKSNSISRV